MDLEIRLAQLVHIAEDGTVAEGISLDERASLCTSIQAWMDGRRFAAIGAVGTRLWSDAEIQEQHAEITRRAHAG